MWSRSPITFPSFWSLAFGLHVEFPSPGKSLFTFYIASSLANTYTCAQSRDSGLDDEEEDLDEEEEDTEKPTNVRFHVLLALSVPFVHALIVVFCR